MTLLYMQFFIDVKQWHLGKLLMTQVVATVPTVLIALCTAPSTQKTGTLAL